MKNFVWIVAGVCAAAAGFLVWGASRTQGSTTSAPVDDLAHRLQDAWADHHTVV